MDETLQNASGVENPDAAQWQQAEGEQEEVPPLERPGTLTEVEAIALAETGWWKEKSPREIVAFQLFESRLSMDFGDFHEAVEKALGRPVWTHEFADPVHLRDEFAALADTPEEEVGWDEEKGVKTALETLPKDKPTIVVGV